MTSSRGLHRCTSMLLRRPVMATPSLPRTAVVTALPPLPSTRLFTTSRLAANDHARHVGAATQAAQSSSSSSPSSPSSSQAKTSAASAAPHEDVVSRSRRSMLYVPGSSEKMIKKSQSSSADTIIFDLEDSVAAHKKGSARETVFLALEAAARPGPELAVRINPPSADRSLAEDDLDMILPSHQLQAIVVPKVEHQDDIQLIIEKAKALRPSSTLEQVGPLALVLSVESAASLLRMPSIIETIREGLGQDPHTGSLLSSTSKPPVAEVVAVLFASEDYCASTGILRTRDRKSLLFPRAHMATIAKAYHLSAIDMVCIDYKDQPYLVEEAEEAKQLGYDGKQAIHPVQVDAIQHTFNPTDEAVERAARILHLYEHASQSQHRGAYGFKEAGGGMTMIDRPMLLQANAVVEKARKAGMRIPEPSELEQKQKQE